jgi:hypothetical protein
VVYSAIAIVATPHDFAVEGTRLSSRRTFVLDHVDVTEPGRPTA